MKKGLLLVVGLLLTLPLVFAEHAPYISFDISEGVVLSDSMSNMTSYNVFADIGYIITDKKDSSYMFMYEMIYQGPGLRPVGSESLAERNQDHYLLFKYMKPLSKKLTLKAKVNYLMEFYRLSKSEEWGEGLYDFNRTGAGIALSYKVTDSYQITGDMNYYMVDYPNYTDLFTEYITNQEISDVKVNNDIIKFTFVFAPYKPMDLSYGVKLSYSMKEYPDQKVIGETGEYTSDSQSDSSMGLQFSLMRKFTQQYYFGGKIGYTTYTSNQNIVDLAGSIPFFIEDYFSYSMIEINPMFRYVINQKHQLLFSLSYITKDYANRPSRSVDGEYLDDKVSHSYILFGTRWNMAIREFLKVQPVYFYKSSSSNNEYSAFVDNNYALHYLGINFLFEY